MAFCGAKMEQNDDITLVIGNMWKDNLGFNYSGRSGSFVNITVIFYRTAYHGWMHHFGMGDMLRVVKRWSQQGCDQR